MVVKAYFEKKGGKWDRTTHTYLKRVGDKIEDFTITLFIEVEVTSKRKYLLKYQPSSNTFVENKGWGTVEDRREYVDISDIDNILEKLDSEDKVFAEMIYKIARQKLKEKLNDKKSLLCTEKS